jgi:F420H(2)-dependent quinone reductase
MHVLLYRVTGGKTQARKYPTMLLTVRGRRTGKPRTTALIYIRDGKNFIIAAAYSGSDQHPTWWLNLQDSGEAVVEVRRTRIPVRVRIPAPDERERLWVRLVEMYPYFAEYQDRTRREIPVAVLTPIEAQ